LKKLLQREEQKLYNQPLLLNGKQYLLMEGIQFILFLLLAQHMNLVEVAQVLVEEVRN
jgi:hypothetical protein